MKQSQPKQPKDYEVIKVWSTNALEWPGHFVGTLIEKNPRNLPDLQMSVNSLNGWLVIKSKGQHLITNGNIRALLAPGQIDDDEIETTNDSASLK